MIRRWLIPGVIVLAAAGAFAVPLAMTARYEPAMTSDSANYLSTAENLRMGEGLRDQSFRPLVAWAPGYPAALALVHLGGFRLMDAVRVINGISFAFIVLVSGMWLIRRASRKWLAAAVAVALLFLVPLIRIAPFAWSEFLFAALVVGCLVFLERFITADRTADLIVASLFGAAAAMVRYSGIAIVVGGAIAIWAFGRSPKRRRALIFAGISGGPLAVWLIKNQVVHGRMTGGRAGPQPGAGTSVSRLLETMGGWFLPLRLPSFFTITLAVVVLAVLAAALFQSKREPRVGVPLTLAFTYIGFVLAAAFVVVLDPIDNRLLAPAAAPLLLGLAMIADSPSKAGPGPLPIGNRRGIAGLVAVTAIVLVLARSFFFGVRYVPAAARAGQPGVLNGPSTEKALSEWVTEYRPPWKMYSNFPEKLYAQAHVRGVPFSPLTDRPDSFAALKRTVRKEEVLLVWYLSPSNPGVSIERLKKEFELKIVTVQADGVAYLVGPAPG